MFKINLSKNATILFSYFPQTNLVSEKVTQMQRKRKRASGKVESEPRHEDATFTKEQKELINQIAEEGSRDSKIVLDFMLALCTEGPEGDEFRRMASESFSEHFPDIWSSK